MNICMLWLVWCGILWATCLITQIIHKEKKYTVKMINRNSEIGPTSIRRVYVATRKPNPLSRWKSLTLEYYREKKTHTHYLCQSQRKILDNTLRTEVDSSHETNTTSAKQNPSLSMVMVMVITLSNWYCMVSGINCDGNGFYNPQESVHLHDRMHSWFDWQAYCMSEGA